MKSTKTDMTLKLLSTYRDYETLKEAISKDKLIRLEKIVSAYERNEIELVSTHPELGYDSNFEVKINDDTYIEDGLEELVLKWCEGKETTEYLIEELTMDNEKYYVTFKVEARYVAEVEADSIEEAREIAKNKFLDADFGQAEEIEGIDIIVENEDGDYVWER